MSVSRGISGSVCTNLFSSLFSEQPDEAPAQVVHSDSLEAVINVKTRFETVIEASSEEGKCDYVGELYGVKFCSVGSADIVCRAKVTRYAGAGDKKKKVWRISSGFFRRFVVRDGMSYSRKETVDGGYRHALASCAGRKGLFVYPELFSSLFDGVEERLRECALKKEGVIAHSVYKSQPA
jgi:hypothetical protein